MGFRLAHGPVARIVASQEHIKLNYRPLEGVDSRKGGTAFSR